MQTLPARSGEAEADPSGDTQNVWTQTRFQEILEALDEALVLWDSDLNFVLSNRRLDEMFDTRDITPRPGDHIAEVMRCQMQHGSLSLPDGLSAGQMISRWIAAITRYEKDIEVATKDGRILNASSHRTGLNGYLVTIRDAQRSAYEDRLAAVNDAIQALDEGLVLYDSEMNFVIGNRKLHDIFYRGEVPHPQVGENVVDTMKRLIDSEFYVIPDGQSKSAFLDQMTNTMKTYRKNAVLTSQAGRVYDTSVHKTALGGYLVSFSDITEQRRIERELEHQREITHQNEKLSALGELLAGVAHELNNPLSIVVGYAQMLQDQIDDPLISRRVERIAEAAERSAKIVKAFLAMARQRPAQLEECRLNDVIENALSVGASGLRSSGAQIDLQLDKALPLVMADADQMAQVFINLIVNAEHALADLGEGGKLLVRTSRNARTGDVVAEIRDNGPGIDPDIQSRIFEPFFTTKDVGAGTGVGLAFCHRIVDGHGGRLTVTSNARDGTSFFVHLSAVDGSGQETGSPQGKTTNGRNHQILVVDDEEHVADLIRELLEFMGHDVTTATGGREALRCIDSQEFDIILSDFKMPDLDGAGFHAALEKTRPDLAARFGIITGDAMGQKVLTFLQSGACPHIEKPIDVSELSALVDQLATKAGVSKR